MRIRRKRAYPLLLALMLMFTALPSCATNHLLRWSEGGASVFAQPKADHAAYVHPAGLVLAFPIAALWDVVTFPFQWFGDVHPFGPDMKPEDQGYGRAAEQ